MTLPLLPSGVRLQYHSDKMAQLAMCTVPHARMARARIQSEFFELNKTRELQCYMHNPLKINSGLDCDNLKSKQASKLVLNCEK
jgi:hypothetical protein